MIWCPLPWNHISVKNNGNLRLCSHSQTTLKHEDRVLTVNEISTAINCDTLKQVRKNFLEGEWPSQCTRCKNESQTGISRNLKEIKNFKDTFIYEDAKKITASDGGIVNANIQFYDLLLGNHCNLRCVMCYPGSSSGWYKDYKMLLNKDYIVVDGETIKLDKLIQWTKDDDAVDVIIENSSNLLKINFAGGEPLLIKQHKNILEKLISKGYSKNISLEYITNLTYISDDIFKLWDHFKKVELSVSIDAYKEANEAIRYPSKWDQIVENLYFVDNSKNKNLTFHVTTTIGILSLSYISKLFYFIESCNFKKITNHISHPIYTPKDQSIFILEPQYFDRMIIENKYNKYLDFYKQLYYNNNIDDVDSKRRFVSYFEKLQIQQSQDWEKIFPIAYEQCYAWKLKYKIY
jgi:MoaA/NifB/PqqE/SkfB family radical SAM enzyme